MSHMATEVYDAFRAAGVDESTAKVAASVIPLAPDLATKTDIASLRADLYRAMWALGVGIVTVNAGIVTVIVALRVPPLGT